MNDEKIRTFDDNNNQQALIIDSYRMDFPRYHDILLIDFEEEPSSEQKLNIKEDVAKMLHVEYLSTTKTAPVFPVRGVMMGGNRRSFVNLICSLANGNNINVIFLVDSGSGKTYLSDRTIEKLLDGRAIEIYDNFTINIHGTKIDVQKSNWSYIDRNGKKVKSHFKDINILGTAYLEKAHLQVIYKYYNLKVLIDHDHDSIEIN